MDFLPSCLFDLLKPFLTLVVLISQSSQPVRGGIALNGRINARAYDGFQFLEPALIPAGSYISLTGIMPTIISNSTFPPGPITSTNSPSLPNSPAQNELINALLSALDGVLANPGSSTPISARRRRRSAAVPARAAGGIRPLSMMRLPMGIFISDQSTDAQHDNLLQQPGAAKSRLTTGLRKIIQRLRQSAENGGRQRATFNYARTFNGLMPIEAVYIPRGYFIPLTKLQGHIKQEAFPSEASKPFAGIEPLTVTQLSGGVFIPHRMPALPNDIPPQIVPPEVKPSKPATDIPDVPSFPSPKPQDVPILPPPKPAPFEDPQTTHPPIVTPSVTAAPGIAADNTGVTVTATTVTSTLPTTVTSTIPVTSVTSTVPTTVTSTIPVTSVTSTVPTTVTSTIPVTTTSVTSTVSTTVHVPSTIPMTSTFPSTPVFSTPAVSSTVTLPLTNTTVTATAISVTASLPASATTATSSNTAPNTPASQPPNLGPPTPPASIVAQTTNPAQPIGQTTVPPIPTVPNGTGVYPEFPADAGDLFEEGDDSQDIIQQLLAVINGTQLQEADDNDLKIPTFPPDDPDDGATSTSTSTASKPTSTAPLVSVGTSSASTSVPQSSTSTTSIPQTSSKASTTSASPSDSDDILDFDPQNTQSPGIPGTDAPPLPPDSDEEDPTAPTTRPAFLQSLNLTVLLPPGLQIRTSSGTVHIQIPPEITPENHEM